MKYVKENSLIVCEDLKVKNLVQNTKLAKHISDISWSAFFGMLKYKSEKQFIQVKPNYTSQTCYVCEHLEKENRLSQSEFECKNCGHKDNADLNAAKNIKRLGLSHYALT